MNIKDDIREGLFHGLGQEVVQGLRSALGELIKLGAEETGKAIKGQFEPLARLRVIFDDVVDNLYFYVKDNPRTAGMTNLQADCDTASTNLRARLDFATKERFENTLVKILVSVLSLDNAGEDMLYSGGHKNAALRYLQYGLKSDAEFWKHMATLTDDKGRETLSAFWDFAKGVAKAAAEVAGDATKAAIEAEKKNRAMIEAEEIDANMPPEVLKVRNWAKKFAGR